MTITTTIGYVLAGLLAAGIIFIGARFLVAPRVVAAGYGVLPDLDQPGAGAYLSVKGVRDIASGIFTFILLINQAPHVLGVFMAAASIIPIGDAAIVLRSGGTRAAAFGIHGVTAVVMLAAGVALLMA